MLYAVNQLECSEHKRKFVFEIVGLTMVCILSILLPVNRLECSEEHKECLAKDSSERIRNMDFQSGALNKFLEVDDCVLYE